MQTFNDVHEHIRVSVLPKEVNHRFGGKGLDEKKKAVMLTVLSDEDHQYNKDQQRCKSRARSGCIVAEFRCIPSTHCPDITGDES